MNKRAKSLLSCILVMALLCGSLGALALEDQTILEESTLETTLPIDVIPAASGSILDENNLAPGMEAAIEELPETETAIQSVDGAFSIGSENDTMSVTASVPNVTMSLAVSAIVIGYNANVIANLTGTSGYSVSVYLSHNGQKVGTTAVVNGSAAIHLTSSQVPSTPGVYDICAEIGGEIVAKAGLNVRPISPYYAYPVAKKMQDGKIRVRFYEDIDASATAGAFKATIGGVTKNIQMVSSERSVVIDSSFSSLTNGTEIKVYGIKFPELFPSYALTFTINYSASSVDDYTDYSWESTSVTLPQTGNSTVKTGILNSYYDDDWTTFTASGAGNVGISLQSASTHALVRIYNSSLQQVSTEASTILSLNSGDKYYVRVLWDTDYTYESASYTLTFSAPTIQQKSLSVTSGKTYMISVVGKNVTGFSGKRVEITYDTSVFEVVDFAAQTYYPDLLTGAIAGTDLTVASHTGGKIVMTTSKQVTSGSLWFGALTVLKLKAKVTTTDTVVGIIIL